MDQGMLRKFSRDRSGRHANHYDRSGRHANQWLLLFTIMIVLLASVASLLVTMYGVN